jgi:hypothetical protein
MATPSEVLRVAANEIGYLEKASNRDLDSKTGNAGSANYTKYWRDLAPGYQGQPWCDCFVKWAFEKAAGSRAAGKALACQSGREWSFYTPTSAQYYKNAGRYFAVPAVGDQIFFKDARGVICHTGLVEQITAKQVTTIEGNTSGASGVVSNGGGVCRKVYTRSNARIAGYGRPMYEEGEDLNATQEKQLRRIYDEVTRTDDPSGRGKRYNDHDHIKWIAATATENREAIGGLRAEVAQLKALIEQLAEKL